MMRRMRLTIGLAAAVAVLALDQASKALARTHLAAEMVEIGPFLNLRLGFNTGVTFGLLGDGGGFGRWALVAVTSAVVVWLLAWMWREARVAVVVPLGLVVGGALGNILDRLRHGAVTDFIDLHVGAASWPTFNLADSAIVTGVGLLLLASLRVSGRPAPAKEADRRKTTFQGKGTRP